MKLYRTERSVTTPPSGYRVDVDQDARKALGIAVTAVAVAVVCLLLALVAGAMPDPLDGYVGLVGGWGVALAVLAFVYALFKLGRALSRPSRPGEPD